MPLFLFGFLSNSLFQSFQEKIIEDLTKIQNDGTVEVDVTQTAPVASGLLEFDGFDSAPEVAEGIDSQISKSIPRLMIAMLVVGTRGDVQPFIALAKKLQASKHKRNLLKVHVVIFVTIYFLEYRCSFRTFLCVCLL